MKKEEYIEKYGKESYEKMQEQSRNWQAYRREEVRAAHKEWRENNPEEVILHGREGCRKGGKYYDKNREYNTTGISGERYRIRIKHAVFYRPYKKIIAPESQIHHQWVPRTADYTGVALVEADQHRYGYIDVIQILEGEITLLTEEEKGRK